MTEPPRASRATSAEWMQTALLAGNLVWTTCCYGGHRPETLVVTLLLTAVLLAVHLGAKALASGVPRHGVHPAGWLFVPFLGYAGASASWISPVPWLGWLDVIWWGQLAVVFWVMLNGVTSRRPRHAIFLVLVVLAAGAVAVACYQRFVDPSWLPWGRSQAPQFHGRGSGWFGIPNSLAGLLILLIPATGALAFRRAATATERVWWGWILAVLLLGLLLTLSRGAWIALALALAAWPLGNPSWSWRRRLGVLGLVLAAAAIAATTVHRLSPRARERLAALVRDSGERSRPLVWQGAWKLFCAAPVLGTGAGSFNVLFERHRPERFGDEPQWAHNEYLNTLSDYGLAGAALLAGAAGAVALRARRVRAVGRSGRDWLEQEAPRAALGAGVLAFALQLLLEFHLKIPALALAFAIVVALWMRPAWPAPRGRPPTPFIRGLGIAAALAALAAGWVAMRFVRGEAERAAGREIIHQLALENGPPTGQRERLERARRHLERAVALAPGNGNAWADLSYAIALFSRVEPSAARALGEAAEAAAEEALRCATVHYEFWVRRGVARDLQGRWREAGGDFARAVLVAPANSLAWYYQADHLSRREATIPLAHGSLAVCLRLDPWNGPGVALRQRLAISARAP